MIRLACDVPDDVYVATSGGADSMCMLSFLLNDRRRRVRVVHVNHATSHAAAAEKFVGDYCAAHDVPFVVHTITRERRSDESPEEFWRNERYAFFETIDRTVVTAHTLDDAVESWIFSSLHGQGRLIPVTRDNVIRP